MNASFSCASSLVGGLCHVTSLWQYPNLDNHYSNATMLYLWGGHEIFGVEKWDLKISLLWYFCFERSLHLMHKACSAKIRLVIPVKGYKHGDRFMTGWGCVTLPSVRHVWLIGSGPFIYCKDVTLEVTLHLLSWVKIMHHLCRILKTLTVSVWHDGALKQQWNLRRTQICEWVTASLPIPFTRILYMKKKLSLFPDHTLESGLFLPFILLHLTSSFIAVIIDMYPRGHHLTRNVNMGCN